MALRSLSPAPADGVGATTATRNAIRSMTVTCDGASATATVSTRDEGPIGPGAQGMQLGLPYSPLHQAMPRTYGGMGGGGM